MKTYYEIKTVSDSVLDVDDASRRVKTVLNRVNYKDFDEDVISKSAFDKTLKERGPQGKNLIWHLTDHNPSLKTAIGKFSDVYMEGDNLVGVTNVPNTSWGNDVLEFYKTGHINQHSIGFKSIQSEKQKDANYGEYNLIKEVMLFEGSAVLWGANDATPTVSVGKSLTKEESAAEYEKCMQTIGKIAKSLRQGTLTDETCELLEIQLTQLQEKLITLHKQFDATEPETPATQPEVVKVDYTALFTNYLTQKQAIK
jgi:HK97 family phage prohead protease